MSETLEHDRKSDFAALRSELAKARQSQKATLKSLEALTAELNDALEQQRATATTLKALSHSAFDLDAMLNALVDSSMALCGAGTGGLVVRINGEYRMRANKGETPEIEKVRTEKVFLPGRDGVVARVLQSGLIEMIADLQQDQEFAYRALTFSRSIVGLPLLRDGEIIGVFVLTKREPGGFTARQIDLVKTFADQAVIAIGTVKLFTDLETRTAELDRSLQELRVTQDKLIQSEKLASRAERLKSLGQMVAGVAHEINTPLGIAITAASHFNSETEMMTRDFQEQRILRSRLDDYLKTAAEAGSLLMGNLLRSRDLVASFKRVSVDEVSGDLRRFDLGRVLDDAASMLRPELRKHGHALRIDCPEPLVLTSYPAAFTQILTNFVMNSVIHAFPDGRAGALTFSARRIEDSLEMRYGDDGVGVDPEILGRIFEHFFTTRRGRGGSGLGLGIVHNLVTQQLGGQIEAVSLPGKGLEFRILAPFPVSSDLHGPRLA